MTIYKKSCWPNKKWSVDQKTVVLTIWKVISWPYKKSSWPCKDDWLTINSRFRRWLIYIKHALVFYDASAGILHDHASAKQQMKMSQVLSSVVAGTATKTSSYEKANPAISPSTSKSQQSMALFSGAVIQGGNFSINIKQVTMEEIDAFGGQWRWIKTLLWYECVVIYH